MKREGGEKMKEKAVKVFKDVVYNVAMFTSMSPSRGTYYDEKVPKKFLK